MVEVMIHGAERRKVLLLCLDVESRNIMRGTVLQRLAAGKLESLLCVVLSKGLDLSSWRSSVRIVLIEKMQSPANENGEPEIIVPISVADPQ